MGDGAADPDPSAGEQNLDSCASFSILSVSAPSKDAACGVGTIPLLPEQCSSCFGNSLTDSWGTVQVYFKLHKVTNRFNYHRG